MILPHFLLILGVLLGGVATYVAVAAFLRTLDEGKNTSLLWADGEAPRKSKSLVIRLTRPMVHRIFIPLMARYPLKEYKETIKRDIQSAGLGQELNADEFVGMQVCLGVFLPAIIELINLLFSQSYPWYVVLGFAIFGLLFPRLYVQGYKNARRSQILVDLPFVIDLLALSTEAGLDFMGAITKVVEKLPGSALGEELAQVLRDLKLGSSRAESLNALAWRLNMSQVSSFIAVLVTADSLGASIGDVLRQQSEQMRQERFVRAEKAGVEASQKVYIPLILFILPAVLIMVFGPVILQFMGGTK